MEVILACHDHVLDRVRLHGLVQSEVAVGYCLFLAAVQHIIQLRFCQDELVHTLVLAHHGAVPVEVGVGVDCRWA